MKTVASTMAALMLALLLAAPVLAGGDTQGDKITKTFKLTLYGDVPEDRVFAAVYGTREDAEGGTPNFVLFCGQTEEFPPGAQVTTVSEEDCVGADGTEYTAEVEFERGTSIYFAYIHGKEGADKDANELFFRSDDGDEELEDEDFEVLNGDKTNTGWYRFGDLPDMPDTGAGGMAGGGLPIQQTSAALGLLAAAGYWIARRRRNIG